MDYAEKYDSKVDELYKTESKAELFTNTDYDWSGAHTVKIFKVTTVDLNNYQRGKYDESEEESISRYGKLLDLNATTEERVCSQDKSFIFNIDAADYDESAGSLEADAALKREIREKVIPASDTYVINKMATGAGTIVYNAEETPTADVYEAITEGQEVLDDAEVPETERALIVSPAYYKKMKNNNMIFLNSDISEEMRLNGVIATLDGLKVIKVPASRLPEGFEFMIAHPSATTFAKKLENYGIHPDTPLASGTIVTGRIIYDAFVLDNKKKGIYLSVIGEEPDGE